MEKGVDGIFGFRFWRRIFEEKFGEMREKKI
jgi:hypothetical protein